MYFIVVVKMTFDSLNEGNITVTHHPADYPKQRSSIGQWGASSAYLQLHCNKCFNYQLWHNKLMTDKNANKIVTK